MIAEAFGRVRALIEERLPNAAGFLPPATSAEIDELGLALGRVVPEELRELLSVSAGNEPASAGPVNFARFLPPREIAETHAHLNDAVGDLSELLPQPAPYRWSVWSPAWIPVLGFNADTYLIDTDPGEHGTRGQIFYRPNAPDLEDPAAPTLEAFLDRIADLVEIGDHEPDEEGETFHLLELY